MSLLKRNLPIICSKQFCELRQGRNQKFWRGIGNFVERAKINKKVLQREKKREKERELSCVFVKYNASSHSKVGPGNRFSIIVGKSNYHRCSVKKVVLKNFTKFTEKHLCPSFVFNKVAGLRPAILLKKRLWYRCFPVNFAKFPWTPFLQSTSGRLLLRRQNPWKLHMSLCFFNAPKIVI